MKKKKFSLSDRVIIIIIAFLLISSILWSFVMLYNITKNAGENALKDEQTYMDGVNANLQSVEEVCSLAQQMVLNNTTIINYIDFVRTGKDYSAVKKIDFYDNELGFLYNMTNINPYLYQIRLFVDAPITEKKPCFYRIDRIQNLDWSDNIEDNSWKFDYLDNVFLNSVNNVRLVGLITNITDFDGNNIGVLEVSTKIDSLFEDFYEKNSDDMCCFITGSQVHTSDNNIKFFNDNKEDILKFTKNVSSGISTETTLDDTKCIVSVLPCKSLNGYFVHVNNTEKTIYSYYRGQFTYIIVVFLSIIIFSIIVILLIRNIFKRFNTLTYEVRQIKTGTVVRLTETGNDEISELGIQINKMLDTLEQLNIENTNKQLLVKNAELRSLQNQINAHFMYNVLESIKMMAEIKGDFDISDAITTLGNMFRYSMKWTSGMVSLKDEVKYIKDYLNLLNLRFDYKITLSLKIPEEFLNTQIPKMSLQPLVENSVYHGIENLAEDTVIYIKVFTTDGIINIEVSDMGVGMSEEALNELLKKINSIDYVNDGREHGRALYNVQQRIKMYFGQEYGLQIYSRENAYTKVVIQIPQDKE